MAKYKKRPDGRYETKIIVGTSADGKYIRKGIYGRTVAELEENIRQAKNQSEQGVDIISQKPTLKEWADKWLEVYKPDIMRSMRSVYTGMINKWLLPLHGLKIDKIRQVQLQEILQKASKTLSQSSMDKLYNCMHGIFSSARQNGLTPMDISENITKPTGGAKTKREALTEDEKAAMLSACRRDPLGALPIIIMYAGLRIGEALALTWADIRDGYIHVSKTIVYEENSNKPTVKDSPKTDAGFRKVPVMPPLKPYLEQLPKDSTYLFMSGGKLYSKIMKRRLWDRLMGLYEEEWKKGHQSKGNNYSIGVLQEPRKITSHMLRHTYITLLYDAGIDVKTAQKWAGHATVSVLMDIYTHLSEGKEKEATKKLERYIEGVETGEKSDDTFDDTDDILTTQRTVKNGK